MTISERLFKIMEKERVSVSELSTRTGISKQTIYDWRKKNTNPGADKIMILCEALRITPQELLAGKPEEEDETAKVPIDDMQADIDGVAYDMAKQVIGMTESQKKRMLAYMAMLMNIKD